MRFKAFGLAAAAIVGLAACEGPLTDDQRLVAGALGGAATGLIAAEVFQIDDNWRVITALAGATAGTLVARNNQTQQCAYSAGGGTYYTAPCP